MELGARFEREEVFDCSLEQFSIVADLVKDYAYAPLRVARLLSSLDQHNDAAVFAKRVLRIDPSSKEAKSYIDTVRGTSSL